MSKIRGLTELVIWVRDMEKALHFYHDVLGLDVMSPPDFRGAVFLQVGESKKVPQQIVLVPLPKDAPGEPAERAEWRRVAGEVGEVGEVVKAKSVERLAPERFTRKRQIGAEYIRQQGVPCAGLGVLAIPRQV